MCSKFDIARKVIIERIKQKKPFSYDEIQDEILKSGGVFWVSIGYSVGDYVEDLESKGVIKYNPSKDKYDIFGFNVAKKMAIV